MKRIVLSGILKFGALSEFFDQVLEGSVNIDHNKSSMAKSSIAMDGSFSAETGETAAKVTQPATSADPVLKGTGIVAEHTKDEL